MSQIESEKDRRCYNRAKLGDPMVSYIYNASEHVRRLTYDPLSIVVYISSVKSNFDAGIDVTNWAVFFDGSSRYNDRGRLPLQYTDSYGAARLFAVKKALLELGQSLHVVDGITNLIFNWELNGWRDSMGKPVDNAALWEEVHQQVAEFQRRGVEVDFRRIEPQHDRPAFELARGAGDDESEGGKLEV
ncbi:uncharacterized protein LY89DRAFT_763672 [Mollisia scopiformis]|uniref:RNase H type-1 domain-containing protein n=1 Tax=Mollisia scopiformis TaxID=149040 RepID=A0A132B9K5_MOLSC|nr:uncharacterized protein LY89DRAFT_763672 [Mollisia scopiformis]KUJ09086.1 hypothetical protein LY89DRAFT_763672 [Mollisia scopiformis]